MERNSRAALGPQELASLRRLAGDRRCVISSNHRQLLLSLGLITAELRLTEAGRNRLAMDGPDGAPSSPRAARSLFRIG
jgi:hypothetical protein